MTLSLALDLSGTLIFALSGALLAVRKDYDVVGVIVLSVAAGLGGGMLRDLLLGAVPPAALRNEWYLIAAMVAAVLGFFFHPSFDRLTVSVRLLDALGLGFFAVVGTMKALNAGLLPMPAVLLGVVTGAGGGVIRDLLAAEAPIVLRRDVYALAALVGALTFVGGAEVGIARSVAATGGVAATFLIRALALHYGWQAPRPRRRPRRSEKPD